MHLDRPNGARAASAVPDAADPGKFMKESRVEFGSMKKLDFWYFWNLTLKHWRWLVCWVIIGGTAGFVLATYVLKPQYEAVVSLYVGRSVPVDNVSQTEEEMRSSSINSELALALQLVSDYKELIDSKLIRNKVDQRVEEDYPDLPLVYKVRVNLVRGSRLIKVSVNSRNPKTCEVIANTMADVFIDEVQNILNIKNSQIIDRADLPVIPVAPNRNRTMALGLVLGFLFAYGLVFLKSILDTSIRTPEQAVDELGLPIMGTIPEDAALNREEQEGIQAENRIVSIGKAERERFNIAEAFRAMRANLQYAGSSDGNGGKVFVVTSTLPGEGKTFNASNVAASLADSGKRTLAINCDLHKPSLGKNFGIDSGPGLVNLLVGEMSFDQVVVRDVLGLPLDLLLCGPIPPNPSRLLLSREFQALLEKVRKEYDYVILDAPPCLTIADASIIGGFSDGILLVVQAGRARSESIQRAYANLRQLKLNVLGVVLNRFSEKDVSGYGYGYGYGYSYSYNYGQEEDNKGGAGGFWESVASHFRRK